MTKLPPWRPMARAVQERVMKTVAAGVRVHVSWMMVDQREWNLPRRTKSIISVVIGLRLKQPVELEWR